MNNTKEIVDEILAICEREKMWIVQEVDEKDELELVLETVKTLRTRPAGHHYNERAKSVSKRYDS